MYVFICEKKSLEQVFLNKENSLSKWEEERHGGLQKYYKKAKRTGNSI